jgi:hypothetical protein
MAFLSKLSFIISASCILLCYALDPSTLQVDLIFPRNNTVYKPTEEFPIVFAIHNFSTAWRYRPYLYWHLSSLDTGKNWPINLASDGTAGVDPYMNSQNPGLPPSDRYLVINSSTMLKQETWRFDGLSMAGPKYFLNIFLGVDWKCAGPVNRTDDSWEQHYPWMENGWITFSLNNSTGVDVNVVADNSCAQPVATIGVLGENPTNISCPIFASPNPAKQQCLSKLDDSVKKNVSEWLAKPKRCRNPPEVRIWNDECGAPNKATSRGCQTGAASSTLIIVVGMVIWLIL